MKYKKKLPWKNFLYFLKKQLSLYFRKRNFLIFQETELSYVSRNGTFLYFWKRKPWNSFYISGSNFPSSKNEKIRSEKKFILLRILDQTQQDNADTRHGINKSDATIWTEGVSSFEQVFYILFFDTVFISNKSSSSLYFDQLRDFIWSQLLTR